MQFLSTTTIAVMLACLSLDMLAAAQEMEMKYRGTEIAPYRVIGSFYQSYPLYYAYEWREYQPAAWITTGDYDGFGTLFQYISGRNARGEKIKMTAPVLNTIYASGNYSYETAFYIPQVNQQNPPAPLDSRATLKIFPKMNVFVRRYSGWSNSRTVRMELQKLVTVLNFDERKFRNDIAYTAGYDGPWSFGPRRNEIWLIADDM